MARARLYDVAVVGSGFAGSILARALNRRGLAVALVEKGRHPRFALGESSTPLANFCLERLAKRYELSDLHDLAAYGRWRAKHPRLRRGLKRGFTFYFHRPDRPFEPGADNERRLLVAASPSDDIADSHWLRSDVDAFLAQRAAAEGVALFEDTEVSGVAARSDGFDLTTSVGGLAARHVVDATGPQGIVGRILGAGTRRPAARFRSRLIFGHFAGVGAFDAAGVFEPGPYPDEKAALHHMLDEGWMYVLPFDHDCTSAGLILIDEDGAGGEPWVEWRRVMDRYPSLASQFAVARPFWPPKSVGEMQYRRRAGAGGSAGRSWALLPHAFGFFDPLFSTGIAWSLLGAERLAAAFGSLTTDGVGNELARRLADYDLLIQREAEQIERLICGAYLARHDPRLFASLAFLYFAAVSYEELRQRLLVEEEDEGAVLPPRGFLGGGEPGWESLFEEAVSRLAGLARCDDAVRGVWADRFVSWVDSSIGPWNLIGLSDPARRNLYPVDLDRLSERADLLGLTSGQLTSRLWRLRGGEEPAEMGGGETVE